MKHFFQLDSNDCGPTCLYIIALHYKMNVTRSDVRKLFITQNNGVSVDQLVSISNEIGIISDSYLVPFEEFLNLNLTPSIVLTCSNHYVVIEKITSKSVYILDPAKGKLKLATASFKELVILDDNKVGLIFFSGLADHDKSTAISRNYGVSFFNILGYLASNKKDVAFIFFALIIVSFFQACIPLVTKIFFDSIQKREQISILFLLIGAQLIIVLFRSIVDIARSYVSVILSSEIHWALLKNFLLKFRSLSYISVNQKSIGDSLQRMQDLLTLKSFISGQFFSIAFALFHIVLYSVLLLMKVPFAFVIFLLGTVLFLVWTTLFLKKRKKIDYARFDLAGKEKNFTYSYFSNYRDIYLFNAYKFFDNKIATQIQKSYLLDKQSNMLLQVQGLGATIINEAKNLSILLLCAYQVTLGLLTLGDLFAISIMLGMLAQPTMQILGFIHSYQDSLIAMDRINELELENTNAIVTHEIDPDIENACSIEVCNVEYSINGRDILRNINFNLYQGESLAIAGASGSGKSTIAKIICKLVPNFKGNVYLDKVDIESIGNERINSKISAVFHDSPVFNLSILENIVLEENENIDYDRLNFVLEISGLDEIIGTLNRGIHTVHGESVLFSAGQKQRVVIARAIYKGGDILIIDEATNALDTSNEIQLVNRILKSKVFKQVILISHREQVVNLCSRILILENGETVLDSRFNKDAIISKPYKNLFGNNE